MFGCYLANLTQSRLVGIFLENSILEDAPSLQTIFGIPYVETITAADLPDYQERKSRHETNTKIFREICESQGTHSSTHCVSHTLLEKIHIESKYADLMIISYDFAPNDSDLSRPSKFLKTFLLEAQCPVITAPHHFDGIEEMVFACDGGAASIHAIKQFAYLLPELEDTKLTVIEVIGSEKNSAIDTTKLRQLVSSHFANVHYEELGGKVKTALFSYLFNKRKTMVIMGAFSRKKALKFFFSSVAEPLIKNMNLPFFISHI